MSKKGMYELPPCWHEIMNNYKNYIMKKCIPLFHIENGQNFTDRPYIKENNNDNMTPITMFYENMGTKNVKFICNRRK